VSMEFGGRVDTNELLTSLGAVLGTGKFPRISIGIAHPSWKKRQSRHLPLWDVSDVAMYDWFLWNKWPDKEAGMIEAMLMPVIQRMMDKAVEIISKDEFGVKHTMTYRELEQAYDAYRNKTKRYQTFTRGEVVTGFLDQTKSLPEFVKAVKQPHSWYTE